MSREDLDTPKPISCLSCRTMNIAAPYAITIYTLYIYRYLQRVQKLREGRFLLTTAGGFFLLGTYSIFNKTIHNN